MCKTYDSFYKDSPPIPTQYLKRALKLILQENSFEFNGKGTKMAVAFANIFMAEIETKILNQSALRPLVWKRYIDDIFSIWNIHKDQVTQFIELANKHHQTIKFTAEIPGWGDSYMEQTEMLVGNFEFNP